MIEELFKSLNKKELADLWPNYRKDEEKIEKFTNTNIRHANIALNSILDMDEKKFLESLFFDEMGWHKKINGNGMVRLKLAAMSLGLTNNIFTFEQEKEKEILSIIQSYGHEEQCLAMRCYMKQKTVTYYTLKKYLKYVKKTDCMSLELYRGIKGKYNGQNYSHNGLECWTTNRDIAERFASDGGYIISKSYPITQIFAGYRSTFKNKQHNIYRHNGFYVRREHEVIVENIAKEYECGSNVYTCINKDIF